MSVGLPTDLTWYKLATDLGSFIGGMFALGAGLAAYLAGLCQVRATRQAAHDQIEAAATEITNTDAATAKAILREIIECNKVTIEGLRICECIKSGLLPMTRKKAHAIVMSSDPIVYRAVAHRIGRLPYDPQAVVHFYMRVGYIQHNIKTIVVGPGDNVSGEEAEILAKNLIIICQLARAIITHGSSPSLDKEVFQITLAQIDRALESAKQSFPNFFSDPAADVTLPNTVERCRPVHSETDCATF